MKGLNMTSTHKSIIVIQVHDKLHTVAQFLTQDWGTVGSSLTGITALWSLSKTHLS